jgi:putative transposase
LIYHVLNRGNGGMRQFHKDEDHGAFERVLAEGLNRYPVDLLTCSLMPTHLHRVVDPRTDAALGRLMGFLGVSHVRRYQGTITAEERGTCIRVDTRASRGR